MENVVVRDAPGKGRGVFAARAIKEGELVERAPIIILPTEEVTEDDVLDSYTFDWGRNHAVVLGYGSLYNHSDEPNLKMMKEYVDLEVTFTALRDIEEGEELTFQYGGGKYCVIFAGSRYRYVARKKVDGGGVEPPASQRAFPEQSSPTNGLPTDR